MISVIIPTCNRHDMLSQCLDCLSSNKQKFSEAAVEVIVTDDSNNDKTKKMISRFYPFVKWIRGPKNGPAANRNNGARKARFDWLIFIDDDCLPSDHLIGSYYREIKKGKQLALEGSIYAERPQSRYDEEAPLNIKGNHFWSCNIAISKLIFHQINGFDEGFPYPAMEDTDFFIRVKEMVGVKFLKNASVIHPWRRMVPFASYKKHLASHRYFRSKHHETITISYRLKRLKILLGFLVNDSILLSKYSFKGTGFFMEKVLLNFLMIFN